MTTASRSLATALLKARFASGLLPPSYTTRWDTTPRPPAAPPPQRRLQSGVRRLVYVAEILSPDSRALRGTTSIDPTSGRSKPGGSESASPAWRPLSRTASLAGTGRNRRSGRGLADSCGLRPKLPTFGRGTAWRDAERQGTARVLVGVLSCSIKWVSEANGAAQEVLSFILPGAPTACSRGRESSPFRLGRGLFPSFGESRTARDRAKASRSRIVRLGVWGVRKLSPKARRRAVRLGAADRASAE